MIKKIGVTDVPKEFCRPEICLPGVFDAMFVFGDQSIEVMRDKLQSRYLRSNVAHKQLARTSLTKLQRLRPLMLLYIDMYCYDFLCHSLQEIHLAKNHNLKKLCRILAIHNFLSLPAKSCVYILTFGSVISSQSLFS